MIDKFTARQLVRHTMMYLDRKYPYLDLQKLHTHDPGWQIAVTEASFWTAFYDDIVKNLPYVEGTEHKFDNPETVFDTNDDDDTGSVNMLEISYRTARLLKRTGICRISDLEKMRSKDNLDSLLGLRQFGKKTVEEVMSGLDRHNASD